MRIPQVAHRGIYYKWYKLPFVPKYLLFVLILLLCVANVQNSVERMDSINIKNFWQTALIGCMNGYGFYFPDTKRAFICEATSI